MRRPLALPGRASRAALAVPAFLIACTVGMGGLASAKYAGDIATYSKYGRALVFDGRIPYADFYFEYPPGAVPVFALPALISSDQYQLVFKLLMALCGVVAVVAAARTLERLGVPTARAAAALAAMVVAPAALGPLFLNRYDAVPAMIVSLALLALLVGRERAAFLLLGIGAAVKVYPVVLLPIALVRLLRTRGRAALVPAAAAFCGAVVAFFAFFVALAPGGVGFSFYTQAIRHLQIESLGASLLLAADKLGLYRTHWIAGKPSSTDLGGLLPDVVGTVSSLVAVAAVLAVAWAYLRGPESDARLVTAFAAAVTAFVVFGKVLSPQYLVWLVPLVPVAAACWGRATTAAFVVAMGLTPIEYFLGDEGLRNVNGIVWVLLLRNLLLVGILVALVARLWEREPRAAAAAG